MKIVFLLTSLFLALATSMWRPLAQDSHSPAVSSRAESDRSVSTETSQQPALEAVDWRDYLISPPGQQPHDERDSGFRGDPCADSLFNGGSYDGVNAVQSVRGPGRDRRAADDCVLDSTISMTGVIWFAIDDDDFRWNGRADLQILRNDGTGSGPGSILADLVILDSLTRTDSGDRLFDRSVYVYELTGIEIPIDPGACFVSVRPVTDADGISYWATAPVSGSEAYIKITDGAWTRTSEVFGEKWNLAFCVFGTVLPPDLQVVKLDVPPTGFTDQSFEVSWSVRNAGTGSATATWQDRVYISRDSEPDETDAATSLARLDNLRPSDPPYEATVRPRWPAEPGTYYVILATDAAGEVDESGAEDNNLAVSVAIEIKQSAKPNLVVRDLRVPANADPGEAVDITWTILNDGTADASPPWRDSVRGSTDDQIGSDSAIAEFTSERTLAPGESITRTERIRIPKNETFGAFWLVACSDSNGQIGELNESDNCSIAQTCLGCLQPDLVVEAVDAPSSGNDGKPFKFTYSVRNVGNAAAEGRWVDSIFLSRDRVLDEGDRRLGDFLRDGPLDWQDPGNAYSITEEVTLPAGYHGNNWHLIVHADSYNTVDEPNGETNNVTTSAKPIEIIQLDLPDLTVTEISGADEGYIGQEYNVAWRITNNGVGTAALGWTDRVYLSEDDEFDPLPDGKDEPVASFDFSDALAPGAYYSATARLILPQIKQNHTWTIFVATDADGLVPEQSDVNLAAKAVRVLVPDFGATADTDIEAGAAGANVTISGRTYDLESGQPVGNKKFELRIRVQGTRRVIKLVSDGNGDYSYLFKPLSNEAGRYAVFAEHPAIREDERAPDATFTLFGLRSEPPSVVATVVPSTDTNGAITLRNLTDAPIDGLKVDFDSAELPDNLHLSLDPPSDLPANEAGALFFTLDADDTSVKKAIIHLRVSALIGGDQVELAEVPLTVHISDDTPKLEVSPNPLVATMLIGESTLLAFDVTNTGGAAAENVHVELPCLPNPGCEVNSECEVFPEKCPTGLWMTLVTSPELGTLAPGESRRVEFSLQPTEGIGLVVHPVGIAVRSGRFVTTLHCQLRAVSDRRGTLEITAQDEETFHGDLKNLDGATAVLTDAVDGSVVGECVTNADGVGRIENVAEGSYTLSVSAPDHGSARVLVPIRYGGEDPVQKLSVFLPYQVVSYEWTVEEVPFEDRYRFILEAVFEADVPAPQIEITVFQDPGPDLPPVIDLPQVDGEEVDVVLRVHNRGLIAADGVELVFGTHPNFEFEPLVTDLGRLEAGSEQLVPLTIRLKPAPIDWCYPIVSGATSHIDCNGPKYSWWPIFFDHPPGTCGTNSPPGGGNPPDGGGEGGGGGSYYNPPSYQPPPGSCEPPPFNNDDEPGPCKPKAGPECVSCETPAAGNDSPPPHAGSQSPRKSGPDPVFLFSGEFTYEHDDLRIPGRGFDFVWSRKYRSKAGRNTAQGVNWDFSYNVSLTEKDQNVILNDGGGRPVEFAPQIDGTWGRDEYFYEINRDAGTGVHELEFAGKGRWRYHPFDGSPIAGKLRAVVDRHGNTMTLNYDDAGRLVEIIDTLDRAIHIAYTADNRIESVTDFAGRQVRYTYYQDGDEGGSAGDLRSVTCPAVVGTSTGNDFPDGKTISYTYTKGFSNERLNHDLLTVTDGRRNDPNDPTYGQGPYVRNVYAHTIDPSDPRYTTDPAGRNFDRLVRQDWGGGLIDLVYVPLTPSRGNDFAIMKTIVRDRVGNVTDYDYDARNRLVRKREYTGRANPTQPTTLSSNRPTGKLRAADPDYFDVRYEWNTDSKLNRIDHPNGTVTEYVYELDLTPDVRRRSRGNLREIRHLPGTHQPVGDQDVLVERFEYDTDFGDCCGFNFVSRKYDAAGNLTEHEFNDVGDRIRTIHRIPTIVEDFEYNSFGQMTARTLPENGSGHRRRDEYHYHADGPAEGYLARSIVDADGFALITGYEYDNVGNVVRMVDARGNDTLYEVNALNQVVRESSRPVEVIGGGRVRYQRDTYYDANNNVTRLDIQNIDDEGKVVAANPLLTTSYDYEILNNVVTRSDEVEESRSIVTEFEYDANRNRTLVRSGEATSGRQPANTVTTLYDERARVFREIRAAGDPDESITQYDYDGNGNRVATHQGGKRGQSDELVDAHTTTYAYDAQNRLVRTIDPMGTVTTSTYDEHGHVVASRIDGEQIDVPGSANNVRLSESFFEYDELDRRIRTDVAFFDLTTQAPIGDGYQTTETVYSDTSQVIRVIDDSGDETLTDYDTANRRQTVTDAKGNSVTYSYDANSNVVAIREVEKPDLGGSDEVFTTTFTYDALNRQTAVIDNIGNTNRAYYDSRSNRTRTLDALDHEVLYQYDSHSRLVRTIRDMDGSGLGSANPSAFAGDADIGTENIVTEQGWDDAGRLVTQTDDNANTTTYVFDALNRKTAEVYADNTRKQFTFDAHGDNVFWTDGNENQVTQTFDAGGRLIRRDVVPGPGVSDDTTFEVYIYDGRSRLMLAEDDDTKVTRQYDSLSHVTQEVQELFDPDHNWPPAVVDAEFDAEGNQTRLKYPSGLEVTTSYDELNRKKVISDGSGMIATYWYVGPGRVARRDYGNGTRSEWTYDGITGVENPDGDLGVKRIIRTNHYRIADGATIDDRHYAWNQIGIKTHNADFRTNGPQTRDDYTYDNTGRLTQSVKSDLDGVLQVITYQLDGCGNRLIVDGGRNAGEYEMLESLPEPADKQVNQYTATPSGNAKSDRNGTVVEMQSDSRMVFRSDYHNRIVSSQSEESAVYVYDVLHRRTARIGGGVAMRFGYCGWEHIMASNDDGALSDIVFGVGLLDPLRASGRDTLYYHHDDLGNVVTVANAIAQCAERYNYDDFGYPEFRDVDDRRLTESAIGQQLLFGGWMWQPENRQYYCTLRYFDPLQGRFTSRDPIGMWTDAINAGNAMTFVGNSPASRRDPWGARTVYPRDCDWVEHECELAQNVCCGAVGGKRAGLGILCNAIASEVCYELKRNCDEDNLQHNQGDDCDEGYLGLGGCLRVPDMSHDDTKPPVPVAPKGRTDWEKFFDEWDRYETESES